MGPFLPSLFLAGLALSLMPSAHQGASCQAATVGGPSGRQELQQGALLPAAAQQQQLMRPDRLQQQQEWEQVRVLEAQSHNTKEKEHVFTIE